MRFNLAAERRLFGCRSRGRRFGRGGFRRNRFRGGYRRRYRYGRSAGEEEDEDREETSVELAEQQEALFLKASQNDADDCLKAYVCQVSARLDANLDEFERNLASNFASTVQQIDVFSGAVEFDLASAVGRAAGEEQCANVYARCPLSYEQMSGTIHQAFHQLEKQTQPEPEGQMEKF